jgi:hypothetical protein
VPLSTNPYAFAIRNIIELLLVAMLQINHNGSRQDKQKLKSMTSQLDLNLKCIIKKYY